VKYAQCVKIWLFDVLVLFLKCVQFLKSCVQFLMDTILNLVIVLFLVMKKGDATNEIMHMFAASGVYIQMSIWPSPFMMMGRQGCGAVLKMTLSRV
jgi:hypothetical protein